MFKITVWVVKYKMSKPNNMISLKEIHDIIINKELVGDNKLLKKEFLKTIFEKLLDEDDLNRLLCSSLCSGFYNGNLNENKSK